MVSLLENCGEKQVGGGKYQNTLLAAGAPLECILDADGSLLKGIPRCEEHNDPKPERKTFETAFGIVIRLLGRKEDRHMSLMRWISIWSRW